MDNVNQPPQGPDTPYGPGTPVNPHGPAPAAWPNQAGWPEPHAWANQGGPQDGPGSPPPGKGPGKGPGKDWKHSKRLRWGAGVTAAVLLTAGGLFGGLTLGDSASPANASQATALNAALNSSAGRCARVTGSSASATTADRKHCGRLALRHITGMYGEIAFHTSGGTKTLAFERGTVVSSSASRLLVKASNGTEWTWALGSDAAIRDHGKAASSGALTSGVRVFVGGQVVGSTKDARLIVIRTGQAKKGASASSASGTAA